VLRIRNDRSDSRADDAAYDCLAHIVVVIPVVVVIDVDIAIDVDITIDVHVAIPRATGTTGITDPTGTPGFAAPQTAGISGPTGPPGIALVSPIESAAVLPFRTAALAAAAAPLPGDLVPLGIHHLFERHREGFQAPVFRQCRLFRMRNSRRFLYGRRRQRHSRDARERGRPERYSQHQPSSFSS
jgi:hypothetical protein